MTSQQRKHKLPENNPFLKPTPALLEKARKSLIGDLDSAVNVLVGPGGGDQEFLTRWLKNVQDILAKFSEFGFTDVSLLNENLFPDLMEALGPLKRAGLADEGREIMNQLLFECNIPLEPLKNEESGNSLPAQV